MPWFCHQRTSSPIFVFALSFSLVSFWLWDGCPWLFAFYPLLLIWEPWGILVVLLRSRKDLFRSLQETCLGASLTRTGPHTHSWQNHWPKELRLALRQSGLLWGQSRHHCSVTQSCLTVCDPIDCSTPGFPVFYSLPETRLH